MVESQPVRSETSSYEKVVTYIDQERCVPLRTELYEAGGRLRKVMEMPTAKQTREASTWVPRSVVMKDVIDETHTELVVNSITIDEKIPRKYFTERALISGR